MIELLRALLYFHLCQIYYLMKNSMRQKYTSPTCSGHLALAGKVSRCYHPEKVGHTMKSWHKILIPCHISKKLTFVMRCEMVFRLLFRVKRFDSRLDVDSRSQSQSSCSFSLKTRTSPHWRSCLESGIYSLPLILLSGSYQVSLLILSTAAYSNPTLKLID